jgi:hypothetical protein
VREGERNIAARHQLLGILGALSANGIEAMPFKGPVLAAQLYGDPALRSFADLDFLIDERDLDATMSVLSDLGYRSQIADLRARHRERYHTYNGQDILFADNALPVEPHWALAPRTFGVRVDLGDLRQRAVRYGLGGGIVRCLSPEDTLLVAAIHGCKEGWSRLIWLVDVAEILRRYPDLDWDWLDGRSRQAGVGRMLRLSLALSALVSESGLPERVRIAIAADPVCQRLARRIGQRLTPAGRDDTMDDATGSVFKFSAEAWLARERLGDRFRYAFRTVTTARVRHFRMIALPERLEFAYPIVKVAHDYMALPLWLAGKALITRARVAIGQANGRRAA